MYVVGEGIRKEPARTCSIICNYVNMQEHVYSIIYNYVNIMHIYINHCAPAMHKCENKIIIDS